jgi:hypothetical protein
MTRTQNQYLLDMVRRSDALARPLSLECRDRPGSVEYKLHSSSGSAPVRPVLANYLRQPVEDGRPTPGVRVGELGRHRLSIRSVTTLTTGAAAATAR